jgi:hypothetical protein
MATTNRFIDSLRSMPAKVLIWIAQPGRLGGRGQRVIAPLVDEIKKHVLAASKIHADDTPVPVLAPGNGKTKTGRLWTYVRDDRPAGFQPLQPCGSLTRKIARANIRDDI